MDYEELYRTLVEDCGYGLLESETVFDTLDSAFEDGTIGIKEYTGAVKYFLDKGEAR